MYCIACLLRAFVVDSMTIGSARNRHPPQQHQRTGLVEVLVEVAALRALDARGAAVIARAAVEQADGVGDPALELLEAPLRDPDAAGVPVVDEDGGRARVGVDVRREAADVPAVA